ncbi:hypothetical protein, partial [Rhizorhabdus sp. FW153]|uniref:hypothetical protein n=1 Tax=Rhizorhabdus sp. FW153 TaxID=3400216 RepID=UPI003CE942BC
MIEAQPGLVLLGSPGLTSARIDDWLVIGQAHEPLAGCPDAYGTAMARLWGDFVAVRRSGASVQVRRPAGGALGAFVQRGGRIVRIASDIEMLVPEQVVIDWCSLAQHLAF